MPPRNATPPSRTDRPRPAAPCTVPCPKPTAALAAPLVLLWLILPLLVPSPAAADEMALRSAEGQRYRAMVQGDVETLERFLDDRLVYTHSHGGVDDKAAFLESLRSGQVVYRKIQLGSSDVVVWSDAAVITGLAVLEVEARQQRITAPVRFTAVYRRSPDLHWRLLAWQTTPSGDVERRPLEGKEEAAPPTAPPADNEPPPPDGTPPPGGNGVTDDGS